jgi:hypothetical protein
MAASDSLQDEAESTQDEVMIKGEESDPILSSQEPTPNTALSLSQGNVETSDGLANDRILQMEKDSREKKTAEVMLRHQSRTHDISEQSPQASVRRDDSSLTAAAKVGSSVQEESNPTPTQAAPGAATMPSAVFIGAAVPTTFGS